MHLFQVSSPRWIILCSWFMESVPCVTWGLGAWLSVVSTVHSCCLPVLVYPPWRQNEIKFYISLCFQWMTSVTCHWSCCTVTLRNRWMSTPSAGWSSCLSSGTRLYTEMPLGWIGEERQFNRNWGVFFDQNDSWHKRKSYKSIIIQEILLRKYLNLPRQTIH